MKFKSLKVVVTAALMLSFAGPSLAQEKQLKAIAAFPKSFTETQSFMEYIERLNVVLDGYAEFRLTGGPEAIPRNKQGAALRDGVVQLLYSAPTMSKGIFPSSIAIVGSSMSPMDRRSKGGYDLADAAFQRDVNAKLLMSPDGGTSLHIYLADDPKYNADGTLDLTGVRLRSSEAYLEFFQALGATPVVMGPGDIYTALERGTIDGIGWAITGVNEAGWSKHLKHWIEPPMSWVSQSVSMNLDTWSEMPADLQAKVTELSIAFEAESYEASAKLAEEARAEFLEEGLTPIVLGDEEATAFAQKSFDANWKEVVENQDKLDLDLDAILSDFHGR